MARKTPTTTTDKTDITPIRKSTCSNLLGTQTLGYEIGVEEKTSDIYWRVNSNTGNGYWDQSWVKFADIKKALTDWPKDLPLTSMATRTLFSGSVNTASFLLASLVHAGVLEPVPDNMRHYRIANLDVVAELTGAHSKPAKAKPAKKAKAATRMPKGKAKPATGE